LFCDSSEMNLRGRGSQARTTHGRRSRKAWPPVRVLFFFQLCFF
jgi:hypothetical protein